MLSGTTNSEEHAAFLRKQSLVQIGSNEIGGRAKTVGKDARLRRERRQKQKDTEDQLKAKEGDFGVPPEGAKIAMWGVAFLDLLGYQEDLAATDVFPPPPKDEALELFRVVVNRRLQIAEGPKALLSSAAHAGQTDGQSQPDEQPRKVPRAVRIATTGFSDSIFLQAPLDDVVGRTPILALAELVTVSAVSLLAHLADGSPMRGGIDIALGMWALGHLHSAATAKAVMLEKCAGYPRILVGQRFLEYLGNAMAVPDGSPGAYLAHRAVAIEINSILCTDPLDPPGSPPMVDYLGANFRKLMQEIDPQEVRNIWLFAHKSRDKFKAANNAKVQGYYDRLIAYVEPRLEVWGLNKST
jgi:hypothetical protein